MKILSFDPGTANFAYTRLSVKKKSFKILDTGFVHGTISNLSEKEQKRGRGKNKRLAPPFSEERELFQGEIASHMKRRIQYVGAERFMVRGMRNGISAEAVSTMNALIVSQADVMKIPIVLLTAAQWKNKWARETGVDLDDFYKEASAWAKLIDKEMGKLTAHTIDSALIGLYVGNYNYAPFKKKRERKRFVEELVDRFSG